MPHLAGKNPGRNRRANGQFVLAAAAACSSQQQLPSGQRAKIADPLTQYRPRRRGGGLIRYRRGGYPRPRIRTPGDFDASRVSLFTCFAGDFCESLAWRDREVVLTSWEHCSLSQVSISLSDFGIFGVALFKCSFCTANAMKKFSRLSMRFIL